MPTSMDLSHLQVGDVIDGIRFLDILAVFNPKIEGISHGMGTADTLPNSQFNVAVTGAESDGMPEQVVFHKHSIEMLL